MKSSNVANKFWVQKKEPDLFKHKIIYLAPGSVRVSKFITDLFTISILWGFCGMNLYCLFCLRQQWYLYWYQECPCCCHTKPKHLPIYFQINIYILCIYWCSPRKRVLTFIFFEIPWNGEALVPCYEWLDMASCLWYMSHSKRWKKKS